MSVEAEAPRLHRRAVIGKLEMARMLGYGKRAPYNWKTRDQLPPHDFDSVGGHPAWLRDTFIAWCVRTGRARRLVDPVDQQRAAEIAQHLGIDLPAKQQPRATVDRRP